MANKGVKGRVVIAGATPSQITKLVVRVVDFDPLFNQDDVLAVGNPAADGRFALNYEPGDYRLWLLDRNPDLVVQVFTPEGRLLTETLEQKDVTADILDLPDITLHRNHLDGWLVTHATLTPDIGDPVALFPANEIEHLVDGAEVFPVVTQEAKKALTSIHLMNLAFDVNNHLITEFKSGFNPLVVPPATNCVGLAKEATLEEVLVDLKKNPSRNVAIQVMVANIPLGNDTVSEVREFFKDKNIQTADFHQGFNILHARAVIFDGMSAIVMGSSFKQSYFSDARHAIADVRHKGSLNHDVSLRIAGPAVRQITKTFETIWQTTDEPLTRISPQGNLEKPAADNVASVQILRTLPANTFKRKHPQDEDLPHGETGILEAYQRAIHNAERFIYIENQYFTSPEIVAALIHRLNDTQKSKLHLIFVLNSKPDLPGYPGRQIDIVNELTAVAKKNGHQMGVYTLWSTGDIPVSGSPGQTRFEIMPIYVHAKVAIIDDTWATVGTANLDGTSMNYHEMGLMAGGYLGDKLLENLTLGGFLGNTFWVVLYFLAKKYIGFGWTLVVALLAGLYFVARNFGRFLEIIKETPDILKVIKDATARPSQHSLPNRAEQRGRNLEMNVVMYNGIAGQPENKVIEQLRDRLWREHLGLAALPPELQTVPPGATPLTWVEFWDKRAAANQEAIKKEQSQINNQPTRILKWVAHSDAEHYLLRLGIRAKHLRKRAVLYSFKDCKIVREPLFPWLPI